MSQLGSPEERIRLYAGLGRVHELTREWGEAQDAYEKSLAETRESGDREAEWGGLHRLVTLGVKAGVAQTEREGEFHRRVRRKRGNLNEEGDRRGVRSLGYETPEDFVWSPSAVRARATEALFLAQEMRRQDLVAQSLNALGVLEGYLGRFERMLSVTEEGISLYSRMGDRVMESGLLNRYAYGLVMTGEPGEAIRRMRDHPTLSGELCARRTPRADVYGMALALIETGDYEGALRIAREGLIAARSIAYEPRLMFNLLTLGDALRALFRLREAGEIYREMAGVLFPPEYRALMHSKLCAVAATAGAWEEAHTEAILATEYRDEAPVQGTEALHRHLEVEALLLGGKRDLARKQLERFGETVGENRRLRLAYLRALAVYLRWNEETDEVIKSSREALRLSRAIGLPGELWQILDEIAGLCETHDEREQAWRASEEAAEILKKLAGNIEDNNLRKDFVEAPRARRTLARQATSAEGSSENCS